MTSKVILITGASSGIGRAAAAHLAAQGYRVFGTSRQPTAETLDGFTLLPLDVTSDESVAACVQTVLQRAGRIDVLINNAGVDMMGALEETTLDEVRWLFETNFFGVLRVTHAMLSLMRARRAGQIINISSGLGRAVFPFEGYYSASKYALEAYSETLRYEMMPFGITVSVVEPGFFKTSIGANLGFARRQIDDYTPYRERAIALFKAWLESAPPPDKVAHTIARIIEQRHPRLRYPVGLDAAFGTRLAHLMPNPLVDKVGRWMLRVDDWRADVRRYGVWIGAVAALVGVFTVRSNGRKRRNSGR